MAFMLAGALLGSFLMTKIEEHLPAVILFINIVFAFFVEKNAIMPVRKKISWPSIQLAVGFLLGHFRHFGTIKGAIKCYDFSKLQLVAAASVLSFEGDSAKTIVYLR
jgi:uncharacterized membrane protein YfcA